MAATKNPLRFGVNIRRPAFPEVLAQAQAAEEAGFDTVTFSDRPPEQNLEAWTVATAVGVLTRRVILAHSTLNVPFRNPALLAKMAASLDVITGGGRVELMLGAGAQEAHFRSYGIPFGPPAERFRALREAVHILRGLWAHPSFTYHGRVYHVQEAQAPPRPVRGTIPIWIGALGPQMLAYTGRIADGWLKNRGWPSSLDELRGLVAQLEAAAERAGRDPATIRRALNGAGGIGESAAEVERIRRAFANHPLPGGQAGLVGTVDQILETIAAYREAGVDTFHLQFPPEDTVEQIRWFGRAVLPRARALAGAPA
jgi:alkanesulfonate monooxygenase SsuD/methylene tetrahydromethanopterin reductase-like flavin-dependent oxidoreductase (luciferase family)